MRITKEILEKKVNILNGLTKDNRFCLDYAYGGVRLCKISNEYDGLSDISERMKLREMAMVLDSIINTLLHIK